MGSAARRAALLGALALLAVPATAAASPPLGLSDCGPAEGVYQCRGLVRTWDGVPLDTTVTLPGAAARPRPLVVEIHGFGNSKYEYLDPTQTAYTDNAYAWARDGYAVLTYTARGLWGSCGTPQARLASPADCAAGYIHLADHRYEVRDTQELIGRLVDGGYADPRRVGVTGDSYGGGQSFALAALRDRVMLENGRLVRWRSPAGVPLRIAAAAPVIPWTDLIYAIAPNGRTLTYTVTPPEVDADPVGVAKQSFATGIFAAAQFATGPGQPVGEPFLPGRPMGFLAPPGLDPEADVTAWLTRATAGEPYTGAEARAVVETLQRYHSSYYVPANRRPPPLFVAAGFTDDLFPVDESLRFLNRAKRRWPGLPASLFLGDFGHQRAGNAPRQRTHLLAAIHRWFDRYLRGRGRAPRGGVLAYTQTCPRGAPSARPMRAADFAHLARGEVRRTFAGGQTVSSTSVDSGGAAVDPVGGGGDACAAVADHRVAGSAVYELGPARRAFTLVGGPTIIARLGVDGPPGAPQLAGRLWDVSGAASRTLIARGFYRPRSGRNVWQLHPGAWRVRPGHRIQLELLGQDAPFGRPSNGAFEVAIERLELRLPVRQRPDCKAIRPPARLLVPRGQLLAPGARVAVRAAPRCRQR
jgi:dienelactone hydrolase